MLIFYQIKPDIMKKFQNIRHKMVKGDEKYKLNFIV